MEPQVLSFSEAAKRLNKSHPTVRKLLKNGKIRATKVGWGIRSHWMVEESSVRDFLRNSSGEVAEGRTEGQARGA